MAARSFVACAVLGGILVATACGTGEDDGAPDGASSSSSSSGSLGGGDAAVDSSDGLEACATDTAKANPLPLDLYIMFDTSGSMLFEASPGVTKMKATSDAMNAFLNDPSSAGISVALSFFPARPAGSQATCTSSSQCGTNGVCTVKMCAQGGVATFCADDNDCTGGAGSCKQAGKCSNTPTTYCYIVGQDCPASGDGMCEVESTHICASKDWCVDADYATPVVPFSPLPAAAVTIGSALANRVPFGGTPTSVALSAAENQAYQYALANTGHTVAVVLVTDGTPSQCNTDIDSVAGIAQVGAMATPKIRTFVIGVFAPADQMAAQPNLDKIAAAGDGGKAFIVNVGTTTKDDFIKTMNTVRGKALPCEYNVPQPMGGIPDYGKVNVRHTSPAGQKTVYPYAKSAAGCGADGGWYFDVDPSTGGKPTKITLCPGSCTAANDAGGQIDVVLGCQTIVR